MRVRREVRVRRDVRVNQDIDRLEALLLGLNQPVNFNQVTVVRVVNEANMLANRVVANVRVVQVRPVRAQAIDLSARLREHLRLARRAAAAGDVAAARAHAREALSFATRLDDLV